MNFGGLPLSNFGRARSIEAPAARLSSRQFIQIISLAIVIGDWITFYKWGQNILPVWRMTAAHMIYTAMLSVWVGNYAVYQFRITRGHDFDDAWFTYVVTLLLMSAIGGVGLKWLENPFADQGRRLLALTMSTGYIALSSMVTLRPPGKRPRGLIATLTPVVQLPAMYFFQFTEPEYLSIGILLSTTFFAFLMLGIREYIQTASNRAHTQLQAAQSRLIESELARSKLQIANAVEVERERLMGEVHDGIGSKLITALAVARRENHPTQTVELLRRAVFELKITVDSLDPLEGDILALFGNLRHRLEPDLTRAGLEVRWEAGECPPLAWMDPPNALQFLRIMQEAVSNVIAHSGASEIKFSCMPVTHEGRDGLCISVSDNGCGIAVTDRPGETGRGLRSMQARAEMLGGWFTTAGAVGIGFSNTLWLPIERHTRWTRNGFIPTTT